MSELAGAAAMVELLSEPLYILALVQTKIGLRVSIEASATILKIIATLTLLWAGAGSEAVALSIAQVWSSQNLDITLTFSENLGYRLRK